MAYWRSVLAAKRTLLYALTDLDRFQVSFSLSPALIPRKGELFVSSCAGSLPQPLS